MKITGGKYRGKNIDAGEERTLRPTSSMIREVIFNLLRHGKFMKDENFIHDDNPSLIEDRRVIDIFCGSGALGIEALSRGAAHLTLVDQNARTLAIAKENIKGINEDANTKFIRSDSTMLPPAVHKCRLAFVDPPYQKGLATPALNSLKVNGWLEHGAIIVLEQGKQDDPKPPAGFRVLDDRVHDRTRITILQFIG